MKSLTQDELNRLLTTAKKHGTRNLLMVLLATCHGLRATEVVGGWLKKKDGTREWYPGLTSDNFRDGFITVQRLKGSDRTTQPLLAIERETLEAYMATIPAGQRLFPVTRRHFWWIVQKHCKEAGIPVHKAHPHSLKATCAKLALKGGMQIDDLQKYCGWKSISSASAYLRSDEAEASEAFGKATQHIFSIGVAAGA